MGDSPFGSITEISSVLLRFDHVACVIRSAVKLSQQLKLNKAIL
jgi:hypothetical protein